jgi:transcription termination factor Rho
MEKGKSLDMSVISKCTMQELIKMAKELKLDAISGLRKQELIAKIFEVKAKSNEQLYDRGILEILPDGFGFLRSAEYNYLPCQDDIYVSPSQIKKFALRKGDAVGGYIRAPQSSERYYALLQIKSINGLENLENIRERTLFDNLTPLYPNNKIILEQHKNELATRIIDMFVPIGKGQRVLINAAPRTGKTVLLQKIANSITANYPEIPLIVLWIDERPEDVTDMQ